MGPTVENIRQDLSVHSSLSAGFGVHCMVAARLNSGQRLLDMREKGVYSPCTRNMQHDDLKARLNRLIDLTQ